MPLFLCVRACVCVRARAFECGSYTQREKRHRYTDSSQRCIAWFLLRAGIHTHTHTHTQAQADETATTRQRQVHGHIDIDRVRNRDKWAMHAHCRHLVCRTQMHPQTVPFTHTPMKSISPSRVNHPKTRYSSSLFRSTNITAQQAISPSCTKGSMCNMVKVCVCVRARVRMCVRACVRAGGRTRGTKHIHTHTHTHTQTQSHTPHITWRPISSPRSMRECQTSSGGS